MAFKDIKPHKKILLLLIFFLSAAYILISPFYYNVFLVWRYPYIYLVKVNPAVYDNSPLRIRERLAEKLKLLVLRRPRAIVCFYPLTHSVLPAADRLIAKTAAKVDFYVPLPAQPARAGTAKYLAKLSALPAPDLRRNLKLVHAVYKEEHSEFTLPASVYLYGKKLESLYKSLLRYLPQRERGFSRQFEWLFYMRLRHRLISLEDISQNSCIAKGAVFFISSRHEQKPLKVLSALIYKQAASSCLNRAAAAAIIAVALVISFLAGPVLGYGIILVASVSILAAFALSAALAYFSIYPDNIAGFIFPLVAGVLYGRTSSFSSSCIRSFNLIKYRSRRKLSSAFVECLGGRDYGTVILGETYNASGLHYARRKLLHSLRQVSQPQLLNWHMLNALFCGRMFVNVICLFFDLHKDRIGYISAGSEPIVVFKEEGGSIIDMHSSLPLGVGKELRLAQGVIEAKGLEKIFIFNSYLRKIKGRLMDKDALLAFLSRGPESLQKDIQNSYAGKRQILLVEIRKSEAAV